MSFERNVSVQVWYVFFLQYLSSVEKEHICSTSCALSDSLEFLTRDVHGKVEMALFAHGLQQPL